MAAKRSVRKREAQLAFEALSIEGGLLSPEWLGKVAQLGAPQQAEADYGIKKGLTIRDEIGRFWRIAQAEWTEFDSGRRGGGDPMLLAQKFIEALLRDCFGFTTLVPTEPVTLGDRLYPVRLQAVSGGVPVVVAPAGVGLDAPLPELGDGSRRRSAFGLAQEYLNANEGAMWGLATDGLALRIVRDNASLTRPAWIEVDLARLFTGALYPEFTTLWLMLHESRFGRGQQAPSECALEQWRTAGREQGTRARDLLRDGVQDALVALGQGFLSHRENQSLRDALKSGTVTERVYFQQLLRLVYRLIFLITAEERDLLFSPAATDAQKRLYGEGYGLRRLRERSARRRAHDRYSDLHEGVKIVFRGLADGLPALGLPTLAGLFSAAQTPDLDALQLENHSLLEAIFRLCWIREDSSLSRVNWRDMGPEELGSVYESLLELVPVLTSEGRVFGFASAEESKGNARKTTGSYYTPDSLVQVLLDSALEPVVQRTIVSNPGAPAEALLSLSILDPACGSGHFLLAAARRLAAHVARIEANGTPSPKEYRHALRRVVGRCIFGVDLNPMAIELCRLALWMEAVEPGKPLSFLDSHLQQGNALLGTTPELMKKGIPDDAWAALEGDDKKTASALKKRNKKEAGQDSLALGEPQSEVATLTAAAKSLDAASDTDAAALAKKQIEWDGLLESVAFQHQKLVADAWCAAFVWPKATLPNGVAESAPTNETWRQIRDEPARASTLTLQTARELSREYEFFHWHLQYPQVFAKGGFDVVLGNPPWDSLRFSEEEFFASRNPEIATATTAAKRKTLIRTLQREDPRARESLALAKRRVEGENAFVRGAGRFPLCGLGRVNLFALFAEAMLHECSASGRVGAILPSGIATDDSTKAFFSKVVTEGSLVSLYDFENREGLFPSVHRNFKFALLTAERTGNPSRTAEFVFYAGNVAELRRANKVVRLSREDIRTMNPLSGTSPTFRDARDAALTLNVHRRVPVLAKSGWRLLLRRLINQSDDSGDFLHAPSDGALPLYEGKYFHLYDHRWTTFDDSDEREVTQAEKQDPEFEIRPRYWFPRLAVKERFGTLWNRPWVLAWRDITNASNERTLIASILPSLAIPNTAKVFLVEESQRHLVPALQANLSSFALDFVARQKIGWTHMATFTVEQLPVLAPSLYETPCSWDRARPLSLWLAPRSLELTGTSESLSPYLQDLGVRERAFQWDPARRFLLRCELDAAFFHLYGLSRDETAYVMETFPIVRRNDMKAHNKYRTKDVILERYDALDEAIRTGTPYQTVLVPPPAAPSVAHRAREGGKLIALPVKPAARRQPAVGPAAARRDIPAWSPELLPAVAMKTGLAASAGRWSTTLRGVDLGIAALAAVLRNVGGAASRDDVERAVVLSVLPGLLEAKFGAQMARTWRRAIGTANMNLTSIAALSIPWAEVLRRAALEHLLETDATERWRPGADIDDAPSAELDARALVSLSWLESVRSGAIEDAELVTQLGVLRAA